MDITELKKEIKERLGIDAKIVEARFFSGMTQDLIEKLYDLYNGYPDDLKVFIRKYIPSGLSIEFYVGVMHNQRIVMEWLPLQHLGIEAAQSLSVVNARVGYVVHGMSPRDKSRFIFLLNSMSKNIDPTEEPPIDNGVSQLDNNNPNSN